MVEFTLFEIHLEDSDLTANAPYSYGEKDVDATDAPRTEDSGSGSKTGPILAAIVGLCFSIAVAYVVKKRLIGDTADDAEEFEI